nr:reverse transcriptase domain-containing protein [Tanacetum cinerariifolium]GEV63774.1 reverse transcriptase domain-containing protein [Tanacetum cinerariifolium]
MIDNCTMAEMLRAPTEGYAEAIVVPLILAEQFELKHSLNNMMTPEQFFGLEKDNPHDHIRCLRNEISNFEQKFSESFHEAWKRYKDLLRACPHHGFTKLHQLNTFYNALNPTDQDSLNTAAGVNEQTSAMTTAMTAMLRQFQATPPPAPVKAVEETCVTCGGAHPYYKCLATGGNTFPEFRDNIQEYGSVAATNYNQGNPSYRPQGVANQIRPPCFAQSNVQNNHNRFGPPQGYNRGNNFNQEPSGVSYDGPSISPPVVENAPETTKDTVIPTNNGNTEDVQPQAVSSKPPALTSEPANTPVSASKPNIQASIPYPSRRNDERNREKAKDQIEKFYQLFKDMSFEISFTDVLILMPKFASTLKSLISNKEKLSEMARTLLNEHCSTVLLKKLPEKLGDPGKFLILCDFSRMAECLALADLGASINLMPYSVWKKLSLPDLTPTCMTLKLADRSISRPVGVAEDVYVKVGSFYFSANFVVVDFDADPIVPLILGIPTPYDDPIVSTTFPTLTPFGDSDFLLFEEANTFLGLEDDLDSLKLDPSYYDPERDIQMLEAILNSDPVPSLPNHEQSVPSFTNELKACEAKTIKSSVDEPPEVELKDLPPHLKYAFLEGGNKLPVIIAKELGDEEKAALIKVLKSHKRAIAWKLFDIQGINPEFCTHKILMEEDYKLAVQHQRRVNPKIHDVIKKENEENELIPTRLVTGWQTMEVFMDDFSVFRNSFETCLSPLDKMLQRYGDTKLCLNWEKSPFMVKEGIVIGHKISRNGIEVDKAKVDDAKARLLRWVLLLQEFDFDVLDTKGVENLVANHLSRLEKPYENVLDPKETNETFPLETFSTVTFRGDSSAPWFADFANYHSSTIYQNGLKRKRSPQMTPESFSSSSNLSSPDLVPLELS